MGFLDHSTNNIIVDAVLTDLGRQRLAQNDGSFSVVKFALGDDEIDYSIISKFGLTVGREKIEKNTPVFEAQTSSNLGLKFKLLSMSSQVQTHVPSLTNDIGGAISTPLPNVLTSRPLTSGIVNLSQRIGLGAASSIPMDLKESVFMIRASSRFLSIKVGNRQLPVSYVSQRDHMAMYRVSASAVGGAPSVAITITPRPGLNQTVYNTYGNAENVISTVVIVTGLLTGVQHHITVKLKHS